MYSQYPEEARGIEYQLCDECGNRIPLRVSSWPIDEGQPTVTCPYCGTQNDEKPEDSKKEVNPE